MDSPTGNEAETLEQAELLLSTVVACEGLLESEDSETVVEELRLVHDTPRAAERRGAAPPEAMPSHADRIQFYLCGAAPGGGS